MTNTNLHDLPVLNGEVLYGIYRDEVSSHLAEHKQVPIYQPIRPPYWVELPEEERQRWDRVAKWVLGHPYEVAPIKSVITRYLDGETNLAFCNKADCGICDYE